MEHYESEMLRRGTSKLFLGLDSSTQGLKVSAIDEKLNIVSTFAINYQRNLPHYRTENGVHAKAGHVVTQPTAMVSPCSLHILRR